MNVTIIGKVLVGAICASGLGTAGYFIWRSSGKDSDSATSTETTYHNIDVFVVSETNSDDVSVEIIKEQEKKNFVCNLTNNNNILKTFDCNVAKASLGDKNHTDLNTFKGAGTDTNKTELKAKDNIFKLSVSKNAKIDWEKLSATNNKIEIVSTDTTGTNKDKKYAILKPLFALYGTGADKEGKTITGNIIESIKTKYFIGKANLAIAAATGGLTNSYKCSWEDAQDSFKGCKIYDFSSSNTAQQGDDKDYKPLTFNKTSTESTKIDKDSYYLIEFTDPTDHKEINGFDYKKVIYTQQNPATGQTATKIEFTKVRPIIGDTETITTKIFVF